MTRIIKKKSARDSGVYIYACALMYVWETSPTRLSAIQFNSIEFRRPEGKTRQKLAAMYGVARHTNWDDNDDRP